MTRLAKILGGRWLILTLLAGQVFPACKDGDDRPRTPFRYDFESEAELDYFIWRCGEIFERTQDFATSGDYGLRLEISSGEDPGLKPILFETDWSSFRFLHFDVRNPAADTVRIKLKLAKNRLTLYPARVDKSIVIAPGTQHVSIALDALEYNSGAGAFSRKHVGLCKIYLPEPAQKTVLYFDHLYVE